LRIEDSDLIHGLEELRKKHGNFQTSIAVTHDCNSKDKRIINGTMKMVLNIHNDNDSLDEIVLYQREGNILYMRHLSSAYTEFFTIINSWELDKSKEDFDKWIQSKINSEVC